MALDGELDPGCVLKANDEIVRLACSFWTRVNSSCCFFLGWLSRRRRLCSRHFNGLEVPGSCPSCCFHFAERLQQFWEKGKV